MNRTFSRNTLALAISAASLYGSVAFADELEQQQEPRVLEEVIVTGQKIETSLQDTKESVAVFTENTLEQRNLTQLGDVIQQTPGVTGNQFGFRIRGVRSSDGASQPQKGDLASLVIDGVTTSGWVKTETTGQLWDVGQVEVLRGPQSTNLGRNALAGAVIINTNDPVYENEGKVRLGFGQYATREYKGVANLNLIDGVSAIRLSVEQSETDGYLNNITRKEKDYGGSKNDAYRLKWLLEPTDDLSLLLSYQRLESRYRDSRSHTELFDRDERIVLSDADASFDSEADLASLTADYVLSDNWSVKSVSAYQDGERSRFNDADQTARPFGSGGGIIIRNTEDSNLSQELRFNFESEAVRGSTGLYYAKVDAKRNLDTKNDINLITQFDALIAPGLGNLFVTNFGIYPNFYPLESIGKTDVETTNWALFSEWEIDLDDSWTTSFGLRYDNEEQKNITASSGSSSVVLPDALTDPRGGIELRPGFTVNDAIPLINGLLNNLSSTQPESSAKGDFDALLPHAGITYHWNDDVSSSFFIAKSYRSGGSELTLTQGINSFAEEKLWSYEFAHRAVVLDGDGVFNTNIYYSDWDNQQVDIQEPGTRGGAFRMTVNAGKSELYGFETSFNYDLNEDLSIFLGAAVSKTKYKEFSPERADLKGNEFAFAPRYTANAGFAYENVDGLFFNASADFVDSSYTDVANTQKIEARTLFNISAGHDFGDVRYEVYVNNLFDKTYATNNALTDADGNAVSRLGAPRVAGARVTLAF